MTNQEQKLSLPSPKTIGPYRIKRSIGKGGMGEVFLAYDPLCKREIAIKKIRPDLSQNEKMQLRFLREAKIASTLAHPSILPIFSIHNTPPEIYYTMPYVEGKTLKEILQGKEVLTLSLQKSIPSLMRIFLQVCEAIAYSHSKSILHRDLKPDNILIGKYGEVFIFDWGIANFFIKNPLKEEGITKAGKIAGTITHLAPEIAQGAAHSVLSDIFALGVILYQILTLKLPFLRKNLAYFKKYALKETLLDLSEVAPFRDIPLPLSQIAKKALAPSQERYQSVDELIADLKNFLEGNPEWSFLASLDVHKKEDWEFQENVFFAKNIAITRNTDTFEWVGIMVSKKSFSGNYKIEATITVEGVGLGFLFNILDTKRRKTNREEIFCLWLGTEKGAPSNLFRSNIAIINLPEILLEKGKAYSIKIERLGEKIKAFLNEKLLFSYTSYLPLFGTHIGFLHKDDSFSVNSLKIFSGSHNLFVHCLAVPDAFFAKKDYESALSEYRRIHASFPGRKEGREALFRAGLVLLEKAKATKSIKKRSRFFSLALEEFSHLHSTPKEPMEYLGKSLVYAAMENAEEEAKCFELALRKFQKHPLLPLLQEHLLLRLHASSLKDRESAYRLILISLLHLPCFLENEESKNLLEKLTSHWEKLFFLEEALPKKTKSSEKDYWILSLAFRLGKRQTLSEILNTSSDPNLIEDTLFSLMELQRFSEAQSFLQKLKAKEFFFPLLEIAVKSRREPFESSFVSLFPLLPKNLSRRETRILFFIIRQFLDRGESISFHTLRERLKKHLLPSADRQFLDFLEIEALLWEKRWQEAEKLFNKQHSEIFQQESSPLYFLYGCFLEATQGTKIALDHFSKSLDVSYPLSSSLLSHFLLERIDEKEGWIQKAFFWEKRQFFRELALYFHCAGNKRKALSLQKKLISSR